MKFLLAIFLPPVAVLLCGRPFAALFTVLLTLLFWLPGVAYAMYVVVNHDADKRVAKLAAAMGQSRK